MNMKIKGKLLGVLLGIVCCFFVLSGCQNKGTKTTEDLESDAVNGIHKVTDHAGNEVMVPDDIKRIVILDITPLPSVYCMLVGDAQKIVGMTPASKNVAVNSLLSKIAPEFADVETGFAKGETINTEELMALDPDVIFYRMETQADVDAISKLSTPAIAFSTSIFKGDIIDTLNGWVDLLQQVFMDDQITQKAEKIIKEGKDVQAFVEDRVKSLSEDEKTESIIIHNYDESGVKVGGTFAKYYLDTVNAINVGSEIQGLFEPVNLEQIYEWNPEIIFLNSFSRYTPEDFYNNTANEGDDWSGIAAVDNKKIFKFPIGMYYWMPPSSDAPLSIQWMAKNQYPELFEDLDLIEITKEYYKEFYGIELTQAELEGIFNPLKEAAFTP